MKKIIAPFLLYWFISSMLFVGKGAPALGGGAAIMIVGIFVCAIGSLVLAAIFSPKDFRPTISSSDETLTRRRNNRYSIDNRDRLII